MNLPLPSPLSLSPVARLMESGEWDEAQDILQRILQKKEQEAGTSHPETQRVRNMLACVHRRQGRNHDAETEETIRQNTRHRSGSSEGGSALAARSSNSPSSSNNEHREQQQQQRRMLEALDTERRVLELTLRRSLRLPGSRPNLDMLSRMDSLADTYFEQNRPRIAAQLHQTVLRLRTSTLGPGNPLTIVAMDSLGRDYAAQGQFKDALRLQEDAVEAGRVHLGQEDVVTLRCIVHLAETYGRVMAEAPTVPPNARAIPFLENAASILERTAGPESSDTASIRYYLAVAYSRIGGRFGDAETLLASVLRWSRQNVSAGNNTALQIMRNLVTLYRHLGKLDRAHEVETLLKRAAG
ncbi:conserved hypothetical protein [Paecilomyces variotii No. 5]|uniref:Tetratricopeptide repeat protein n=1 Tax=Byssochlamys spectabilis (strain No. 5 / NBRC 109023) TaxID=1356009 RepID=V5FTE0_BYSSN|nr:conserved hypothetical protein [Paecilomyces variotii No. 5]